MTGLSLGNRVEMAKFNVRRLGVDIEYHTRCINESTAYLNEIIIYEKNNEHLSGVVESSKQLRETVEKDIINHTRLRDKAIGEQQRLIQRFAIQ